MSGPKVVRIVTEEERSTILETEIARLESAMESLLQCLQHNGLLSEQIKQQFAEKLIFYKTNFSTQDYGVIAEKVAREVEFIKHEKERYQAIAIKKVNQQRIYRRNLSETIKTFELLRSRGELNFEESFFPAPDSILSLSDEHLTGIEEKINTLSVQLASRQTRASGNTSYSPELKEMIARLNDAVQDDTPQKWQKNIIDTQTLRIDTLVAELATLECDDSKKEHFYQKANRLYEQHPGKYKSMQINSFTMELSQFIKSTRELIHAKERLKEYQAILESLNIAIGKQIEKALKSENIMVINAMLNQCRETADKTLQQRALESGRKAIINGLNSLGYTVNQEMQTALVKNGQLVVQNHSQPEYGVEVRGIPHNNKVQVRLVSHLPENERRANDDKDAEEKWCNDFSKLRNLLAEQEVDLDYEIALKPGEQPVKYCSELKSMRNNDISASGSKARSRGRS